MANDDAGVYEFSRMVGGRRAFYAVAGGELVAFRVAEEGEDPDAALAEVVRALRGDEPPPRHLELVR
jgi:hypothetical protein